jgi:LPS-assembly protein
MLRVILNVSVILIVKIKKLVILLKIILSAAILGHNTICLAHKEIKLTADTIDYQGANHKILTAKGNVIIERLDSKLTSNEVIYNVDSNEVEAIGNVVFQDNKGNTTYAKQLILTGDFKQAVIYELKLHTTSKEKVQAEAGFKLDATHYQLNNAYYTPCTVCGDQPAKWSFEASKAKLNLETNNMSYSHARFYIGKMPVLYLPYFTHSLKGAERKSGFLRITVGRHSNLGNIIKIPYYINLAPDRDATLTLMNTSFAGSIFQGEYRQLTEYGSFDVNSLFTKPPHNNNKILNFEGDTRYNIQSNGAFIFDKDVFLDYNINYTSDQNFLRTYGYSHADYTLSNILTSYYDNYNSIKVESLYFQNLRHGELKDCNPLIIPHIQTYYEADFENDTSTQFYNKSDYLYLHQNSSHSINRFSINNGIKQQYISDYGHHFRWRANLRTDLYYYYLDKPLAQKPDESDQSRVIPEFTTDWSYPQYKYIGEKLLITEPVMQVKISPTKNYNANIYNQDSQDSELDFSNLFAESKFTGIDLVERGSRISYGLKNQLAIARKANLSLMAGQSYSSSKYSNKYLYHPDFESKLSSYVGFASLNYDNNYIASYKFKLNRQNFGLQNNEIMLEYRKPSIYFITEYVAYKDFYNIQNLLTTGRKEINFEIGTTYIDNWSISVKTRNNLNHDYSNSFKRGVLNFETNITYFYDCFGYKLKIYRDFTTPVGSKPSSGFTFGLILKNIN